MVRKAAQSTPNRLLQTARRECGWTQQDVADRIGAPLALMVGRWERGATFPSAYYLQRLCLVFGKSPHELGLSQVEVMEPDSTKALPVAQSPSFSAEQQDGSGSSPGQELWMLPYPRNPFFLGREGILAQLEDQLQAGQPQAISQPQAIDGLGGVGKTQVALEYAYRHAQDYQAVLWIRADSREALVTGFLEMAQALHLPERDQADHTVILAAVKGWFNQRTSWLLILDNADDLSLLPEFLPAPVRGHLLLTTRAQALGQLANRIEVQPLDAGRAALLLLRRAGWLALDAPLTQAEQENRRAALQLTEELGGLPLALDQAGAYLEETGCSLADYVQLYRSHRRELLRQRGGVVQDHPDSVAATWSLSFARVESRSPLAADLLRLCAVLHPDAIPEELFLQGAAHLGPVLSPLPADPLAFNQALAVIQSYSLLRRASQEHTLSMHRLVQAVLQDMMDPQERGLWTARATAALDAVFPEIRRAGWEQWNSCDRLFPHVLTVAAATPLEKQGLDLATVLTRAADFLFQRAQYAQAEPLYQQSLALSEQLLGSEHPRVAFPLNGLADVYREQGHYQQAESLYQRALRLWHMLDQEEAEILAPLNDLAILYQQQGNFEQAELLLQRDLVLKEQRFGQEHPRMAAPLNNLAILYTEQGHYQQAEPLLQRALAIDEQTFGPDHPEVAYSLTNLADLSLLQGHYQQAEPLYQRALRIREQALGPEHLQVTYPLNGLANVYRDQGRYEQAEALFQRALALCLQARGPQHPETAVNLHELASLYERWHQPDRCNGYLGHPFVKRSLELS